MSNDTRNTQQKIFLITGVSSGIGQAFATAALEAGHIVVANAHFTGY